MSGKWVNSWVWRSANTALKGKKNTARKQGGGGNIEKWKAASLTVPDTGWKQAFRVIVTKDVESKNRSISSYETKACYNRCIVVAVSISTRFKKWGFIISDYQGCVPCHGWLILRCHCPGLSPSPGRVQCSMACGAMLNRAPTGMSVPQRPCPHVCTETGVRSGVRRMFPSGSGKWTPLPTSWVLRQATQLLPGIPSQHAAGVYNPHFCFRGSTFLQI